MNVILQRYAKLRKFQSEQNYLTLCDVVRGK